MKKAAELPIFFDRSGRRWRVTKLLSLIFLVVLSFSAYKIIPVAIKPVSVPTFSETNTVIEDAKESKSPAQIAYSLNRQMMPIIGEGPLLRVVKSVPHDKKQVAVDVYSGAVTKELSKSEALAIQSYAIERYGQTKGKRIALTFDDGPDPTYTPQLLDLLSRESAPSTFFAIGGNVTRFPELSQRLVREGHVLGNHTFTHVDFDHIGHVRSEQEITQTQRIIRAVTKHNPAYFRLPYGGNDDASIRDNMKGILEAQKLGYIATSYHIDSNDWDFQPGGKIELPTLDGEDQVILLHDGGGDRSGTLAYVEQLLKSAKAQGYTFVSLESLYPRDQPLFMSVTPSFIDRVALMFANSIIVWPRQLIYQLFIITLGFLLLGLMLNIVLAILQLHRYDYKRRKNGYNPLVSILVPAFNEEKVLSKTVRSLLYSHYRNYEIIIIDDGSKDQTWQVIEKLSRNKRVRGIRLRKNKGKSGALNRGLKSAKGEVIVSIDSDTIFAPQTVGKFVRHFNDPAIGAVAGVVKVGNIRNVITRWQSLEYITGINIERTAQAFMKAILIVPGACSAWRKSAVKAAHGYSSATLAEDSDLTLAVRRAGYQIIQDIEAVGFTESPLTLRALAKQRFRWTFGSIQAFWKHRHILFRMHYGWLGMFVLPRAIIALLLQFIFTPILLFVTIGNVLAGEIGTIIFFLILTSTVQLLVAIIGLILSGEHWRHLLTIPAYRAVYSPMRTYILYSVMMAALKGANVGWNKIARTGTVRYSFLSLGRSAPASEPVKINNRLTVN